MSSTSTAARPPVSPPAPQVLRPAAPTAPAGTAGRYRYDVATGRWWWSPGALVVLGLPPTAGTGDGLLLRAAHRDDRGRVGQALADACSTGTPVALEHRVVRPDGRLRTVVLVGEPETAPGGVTALAGVLVDVTDARPAGPAGTAEEVHRLATEVEQLRQAMASRAQIEQAKGILMLLMGCGEQVAFEMLAHISSHTHRKVRDVAEAITGSAGGGTPLPEDVRAILRDASPPGTPRV